MNKPLRLVLALIGAAGVGVVVAQRLGVVGGDPGPKTGATTTLPLSCRLRGHGWKTPANNTQTPTRRTCQRCQRIDVPMPR